MKFAGDGPWELPLVGFEVLRVTFAHPLDIVAYGDEGASAPIRLEGSFELIGPAGGSLQLDASAQTWEDLAAVLAAP